MAYLYQLKTKTQSIETRLSVPEPEVSTENYGDSLFF